MESGNAEPTVNKIPFLMVLVSNLFSGSLFVVVNIPLLFALGEGRQFWDLFSVIKDCLIPSWKSIIQVQNVLGLVILIFAGFSIGLVMAPVERGATFVIAVLFRRILKKAKFFSSQMMIDNNYPKVLSWLFDHPAQKLNWEWELFLYYLYWSVSINLGIAFFLNLILLWGKASFFEMTIFLGVVGLTIAFGLSHSALMAKIHQMYLEQTLQTEKQ